MIESPAPAQVLSGERQWSLIRSDCREALKGLPDNSVDAVVTDPPAGIGFMGKDFDSDRGGRQQWVDWLCGIMRECLRVLKPGGHAFVWALPRTSHWTATAVEDAGFEIRDVVTHIFGSGFPKSYNVGQAVEKLVTTGKSRRPDRDLGGLSRDRFSGDVDGTLVADTGGQVELTTEEGRRWAGWGTALKPANEHWILARKPVSEKTVAANVLKHGTGAINIEAGRVGTEQTVTRRHGHSGDNGVYGKDNRELERVNPPGRFPANLLLSHAPGCVLRGTKKVKGDGRVPAERETQSGFYDVGVDRAEQRTPLGPAHADADGMETVEDWACVEEGCPIRELDRQSGPRKAGGKVAGTEPSTTGQTGVYGHYNRVANSPFDDEGGASRFFKTFPPFYYTPKAARSEREEGLVEPKKKGHTLGPMAGRGQAGLKCRKCRKWKTSGSPCQCPEPDWEQVKFQRPKVANVHPTVKPVELMAYLVRLITKPKGVVLDPFAGSGTTGMAALQWGFRFIGFEADAQYAEIALARIAGRDEKIEGQIPLFHQAQAQETRHGGQEGPVASGEGVLLPRPGLRGDGGGVHHADQGDAGCGDLFADQPRDRGGVGGRGEARGEGAAGDGQGPARKQPGPADGGGGSADERRGGADRPAKRVHAQ
jgi:site-specific DNA-methyltransferase (adenine-specific)